MMLPLKGPIRAVFFDLDGTLADTEPLQLEALRKILSAYGVEINEREYYEELLPLSYRDTARVLLARNGRDLPGPALDELERLIARDARQRLLRFARLEPHALECLDRAAALGPVGLVTSTARDLVVPLLDGWGVTGRFQAVVCGGDVADPKPSPAPYRAALEEINRTADPPVEPAACVVFEDAPHGIRSALDAGMRAVGVATYLDPGRLHDAERVVDRISAEILPPPPQD